MSQNREAPAYQEYAAAMMARIEYRTMTLQERGLLYTMRHECWANKRLPEKPGLLAKVLGFSEQEIIDCLPAVMPFFRVSEGFIFSPELEDYRKYLDERKERKSEGGKRGAAITNEKKRNARSRPNKGDTPNPSATSSGMPTTNPQQPRRVKVGSLVQSSTEKLSQEKQSQNQSLEKEVTSDPWLDDYDAASNEERMVRIEI
ncbi:hypothetical protein SAMN05216412_101342 [Nitrosospira multiformis]|uniref:DUF1376 domain-containing protein n=1 Tax=Nitrosospira multiformis TaxID=1231 RepID=A0A1H9YR01_9PROT|nr:hypothetical protein [Nitrosospira multiformis]SES71520.1 hypothetical protein SAMN05216412_101342 [Nitrosospira multiformis]